MSADTPHPAAVRRTALASLLILVLLLGTARAQRPPLLGPSAAPDPVEKVRQALLNFSAAPDEQKAQAQKELDQQLKDLRGISQLGRALQLDWGARRAVPGLPLPGGRKDLATRVEKEMTEVLAKGDPARQCAAATLVAGMAEDEYREANGFRGPDPDRTVTDLLSRLLPDIAGLSKSKEIFVRETAARAVGRFSLDPDKTIKVLETFLGDEEAAVRQIAAKGLVRQVRGVEAALDEYGARNPPVEGNFSACAVVVPVAVRGLNDRDEAVRRHSLEAISSAAQRLRGATRALQMFLPPVSRPVPRPLRVVPPGGDSPVLAAQWGPLLPLARALGDAVPAVAALARDKDVDLCVRSCQALEEIAAAHSELLRGGASDDKDPLLPALKKDAVPALKKCAGHADIEVRLAALYALEELGPAAAPAVEPIIKDLQDDDSFVRWAAARVLGKMAPAEAATVVPALATRVADENGDVRITALAALVRYRSDARRAVKAVSQLIAGDAGMKKWDEQTRLWAVRVLAAIGPEGKEETNGPLIEALSAKEVAIRRVAVAALAQFGKPDKATIPALRTALADPDPEVRRMASETLLAE